MSLAPLMTSLRGDWKTPHALYVDLVVVGGRYDVSDTHDGTFDAMRDPWPEPWFANPPYGRGMDRWTRRMAGAGRGVALLPARTDTRWFHFDLAPHATGISFLRGRLHFDDGTAGAPFPSMLVWFGGDRPSGTGSPSIFLSLDSINGGAPCANHGGG